MLGLLLRGLQRTEPIRLPGTMVDDFAARDSVTPDNRGVTRIFGVNRTMGETFMRFACEAREMQVAFHGKHPLLSHDAWERELYPLMVSQVDTQQLKTFQISGMVDEAGKGKLESAAIENDDLMLRAFQHASQRVTLRILRLVLSELTVVFAVKGFREALRRIKPCRRTSPGS